MDSYGKKPEIVYKTSLPLENPEKIYISEGIIVWMEEFPLEEGKNKILEEEDFEEDEEFLKEIFEEDS